MSSIGNILPLPAFRPISQVMGSAPPAMQGAVQRGPVPSAEVHGALDGAPLVLDNGLRIERRTVNGAHVTHAELNQALQGLAQLPTRDLDLVARAGVPIRLVPAAHLEHDALGRPLLGATTVEGTDNRRVTMVRVAVSAGRRGGESTGEILQHELGHAVSVLTTGNESEHAAEAYASRY